MSYFVYIHTTPSNKRYIGVTSKNVNERWGNGRRYHRNFHFSNAIKKYGWDNIDHKVFEVDTKSEMFYLEKYLIAYYQSNNPKYGYNRSTGGEAGSEGVVVRQEVRDKIAKSLTGRKQSEETVEKRRQSYLIGHPTSEETRKKLSESNKGKHKTTLCEVDGIRFESYRDAAEFLGVDRHTLSCMIRNGWKCKGHRVNKIER